MEQWYTMESWDETSQKEFFTNLRQQDEATQAVALVAQSKTLTEVSNGNHDLLKAAESLMNMYMLKFETSFPVTNARQVLAEIYSRLGEPEKASRFLD